MRHFILAFILFPIAAFAQQTPAPVQALAAMLQECTAREANARLGAAMLQVDIASLKVANEDLKKQLKAPPDDAAAGNR
jgi:hypothetical protein